MKKIFTKLMLLAVAATALVSCGNNYDEQTLGGELTQTVTLSADKPTIVEEQVRTELIGGVPYWSKGDQIGVYVVDGESYKNYAFKNDSEEASLTTSFTGTTAVANTLYVYYPYTNFNNPVTEKGVKVEILANQEPTAASFDGRNDLMLAKPVQLDAEGKQLSDLEFARVGAIVKIVLKDKTGNLSGQHISALTMTAESNLVGRVYLNVKNQELGEIYYGGKKGVTATYSEATQYEVDGENATYVVVYPQTLAAGSTLSFEATTEVYTISKSIELGKDVVLQSGALTTLNVSLDAANVVKVETGLALPFEDDFAWVTGTNENTEITESLKAEYYASGVKAYSAGGAIKFGIGSVAGSITTVPLDLSEPFTVIVKAKKFGSDNTKIKAVVGETSKEITLTADYAYYGIEFEAATKKSSLTLAAVNTSNCRFYIDELQVVAGHDVVLPTLPPVLTVSKSEISVSHEAATETFTYSVANPVDGVNVAVSDNADWIETSVSGTTVTVTVAENTAEEARNGVITVAYEGAESKTVTVSQVAKSDEGSSWIRVTSLAGITSGTYVIIAKVGSTDYYCPNSTFYTDTHPKAVKIADKSVSVVGDQLVGTIIDDMKWTFTGTSINMIITKYNSTSQLYNIANNNGVCVATPSNASYWKFSVQGDNFLATYNSTDRCLGTYDTQDWRSYQNINLANFSNRNGEIRLYKLVDEEGGNGGSTPEPAIPTLSLNTTTIDFGSIGGSESITCTIENEISGVNVSAKVQKEDELWLSTSVNGNIVTITAAANIVTSPRQGTVTISYEGAESKTVTVSQAAAGNGEIEVKKTYTFSSYTAGTQYAKDEVHELDDVLTITTTQCHFTTELRIYSSSTHNGYVIGTLSKGTIKSLDFNAGYKKDTLVVYGSTDGTTWTTVEEVSITSTSYNDYSVDFGDTQYTYFKLDVKDTEPVRLKTLTLTYID